MTRKSPFLLAAGSSLISTLVLAIVLTRPVSGAEIEKPWRVRAGALWNDPGVSFADVDSDGDRVEIGTGGDSGYFFGLEYRFSRHLGIEASGLFANFDVSVGAQLTGEGVTEGGSGLDYRFVALGLDIHLTPDRKTDLYFSPQLADFYYPKARFSLREGDRTAAFELYSGSEIAVGLALGLDVPIGQGRWFFNGTLRAFQTDLRGLNADGDSPDLGFDPILATAGIGARF